MTQIKLKFFKNVYTVKSIKMVCNALPYFTHSDGYKYVDTFPRDWLENEHPTCGPINCPNCRTYGSINGIFVGYCVNCACSDFEGKRGNGFIGENRQYYIEVGQFFNPEKNRIENKFEVTNEINDIGDWNFYLIQYQEQILNELDFEYQNMLMGVYPSKKNIDNEDKAISMVSSSSQYAISSLPAVTSVIYPEYEGPNYADSDSCADILRPRCEYSPAISPVCSSCESSPRSCASVSIGC